MLIHLKTFPNIFFPREKFLFLPNGMRARQTDASSCCPEGDSAGWMSPASVLFVSLHSCSQGKSLSHWLLILLVDKVRGLDRVSSKAVLHMITTLGDNRKRNTKDVWETHEASGRAFSGRWMLADKLTFFSLCLHSLLWNVSLQFSPTSTPSTLPCLWEIGVVGIFQANERIIDETWTMIFWVIFIPFPQDLVFFFLWFQFY